MIPVINFLRVNRREREEKEREIQKSKTAHESHLSFNTLFFSMGGEPALRPEVLPQFLPDLKSRWIHQNLH